MNNSLTGVTILEAFLIVFLACLIVYLAVFYGRNDAKVYPCHLAEISPDYPPDVKAMCRKLTKKWQQQ
jgi:hypothetical protein